MPTTIQPEERAAATLAPDEAAAAGDSLVTIIVRGGCCELDDRHAVVGTQRIERLTDEPFPDFQARCRSTAREQGAAFAVIGGLGEAREFKLSEPT